MGLDADSLQSSSPAAVEGALSAAQSRVEFLARIFAEQALKPLFYGIYRLLVQYKPKQMLMKLRGTYVPINFEAWESDYYCSVEVALGTSLPAQKLMRISAIVQQQAQILQGLGPNNPLVTYAQYRHGLARLTELSGERDVGSYWKPVDPNYQPPPAPPPPPSPEEILAKSNADIEKLKASKEMAIKQADFDLKTRKQNFDEWMAVQKLAADKELRRYAIDAQFKAGFTSDQLNADVSADEAAMDHAMTSMKLEHARAQHLDKMALAHRKLDQDMFTAGAGQQHDMNMQGDAQDHAAGMQSTDHAHEASMQAAAPAPAQE
jgi:hypothetical protein